MRHIDLSRMDEQWLLRPCPRPEATFTRRLEDRQFLEMERGFAASGGLVCGDELARRLRRYSGQPLSTVARWIVERRAVSLAWEAQTLLPMFQFDRADMTLRTSVTATIHELTDVFDAWHLALWFARPNTRLSGRLPADVIAVDGAAVLDAARAERFTFLG